MEKSSNWFAVSKKCDNNTGIREKIWETYLPLHLKYDSGTVFSSSACVNQPTSFSVTESSTPNGLFQTINWLKRLMGYSKRLHQLYHGVLFHLKMENLEVFVND